MVRREQTFFLRTGDPSARPKSTRRDWLIGLSVIGLNVAILLGWLAAELNPSNRLLYGLFGGGRFIIVIWLIILASIYSVHRSNRRSRTSTVGQETPVESCKR